MTTQSTEVQLWFDRGLMWIYGYNHEEVVNCFKKTLGFDPSYVMAYWGIAYRIGCNYNRSWKIFPRYVMAYWGIAYRIGCNYNRSWKIFPPKFVAKLMNEAREAIHLF